MTKLLSEREVGGMPLLTVELSEVKWRQYLVHSTTYARMLSSIAITGAYPDEVAGLYEDIRSWVKEHSSPLLAKESIKEPI